MNFSRIANVLRSGGPGKGREERVRHIVANITWNSWGWRRPTTVADRAASGHANIKAGFVGNESWNFSFDQHVDGRFKYGSFENAEKATGFAHGEAIVFFWSRRMFVGLYARPELLKTAAHSLNGMRRFNVKVATSPDWLIQPFVVPIPAVIDRHLREGSQVKQRPGQRGFCYVDDASASNIVHDALGKGNGALRDVVRGFGFEETPAA